MNACTWALLMRSRQLCFLFFFFFSSRRRHTRSLCDWSSDVCSSDLTRPREDVVHDVAGGSGAHHGIFRTRPGEDETWIEGLAAQGIVPGPVAAPDDHR